MTPTFKSGDVVAFATRPNESPTTVNTAAWPLDTFLSIVNVTHSQTNYLYQVALQRLGASILTDVRAATTANGTLATAFANGQVVDGVTLVTGDRILLKNQTTATQNGIYTVAASGAPTRATDADTQAELINAAVAVSEGTANAGTRWICTNVGAIVVGTTNLTFGLTGPSTTANQSQVLHIFDGVPQHMLVLASAVV